MERIMERIMGTDHENGSWSEPDHEAQIPGTDHELHGSRTGSSVAVTDHQLPIDREETKVYYCVSHTHTTRAQSR